MQPNRHGWLSIRGSARQGKMQDKQGRDDPPVPVMPEVAVHRDGGLRRPAQEAARPATAAQTAVRTALEAALPARVAQTFTPPPPPPPPRFSGSRNPPTLPPTYLSTVARPRPTQRPPSGPRSPSETSQWGLPLLSLLRCSPPTPPASARTGHYRLERPCRVAPPTPRSALRFRAQPMR